MNPYSRGYALLKMSTSDGEGIIALLLALPPAVDDGYTQCTESLPVCLSPLSLP